MEFRRMLRTFAKIFLPLAFGCLLLWYLYSKMDIGEIWQVIRQGVAYEVILFSLLFGLVANLIRGFRWALLIRSAGDQVKTSHALFAVLGNYAVNLVFPRVGEVWRCGMITKHDKVPFSRLLGTLLVDRVCDSIMVGLITCSIFVFNFGFFRRFFADHPALLDSFQAVFHSTWIYGVLVFVVLFVWAVLYFLKDLAVVQKIREILLNVWAGIRSVWLMERKSLFLLETVGIWVGYFFYFYVTFYAFDFTRSLGVVVGLIAFTMSSIAVAVPVQGAIGPWHFMVIATLTCFGVKETDAAAFALVVHTVQTIWLGLTGLVGVVALSFVKKEDGNTSLPAEQDEEMDDVPVSFI